MKTLLLLSLVSILVVSCSRSIYIVRHAEKAAATDTAARMMANNPPLSEAGKVRAIVLKETLIKKHIGHIYSTNTVRTTTTAGPLSQATNIRLEIYGNVDSLVNAIKANKGNALVVGHSNTVDDIVNKLCGKTMLSGDLADGEYDNLFVVRLKGKKARFEKRKYGYPSNP